MVDGGDGVSDCAIGIAILTNTIESRFTTASICPTSHRVVCVVDCAARDRLIAARRTRRRAGWESVGPEARAEQLADGSQLGPRITY